MDEKSKTLLRSFIEMAKEIIVENNDLSGATVFLMSPTGNANPVIINIDTQSEQTKDFSALFARTIAQFIEATHSVFMTTAWMVQATKGEQLRGLDVPPSQHPDRIEVLQVVVETPNGAIAEMWRIQRDGENISFTDMSIPGVQLGGRFMIFKHAKAIPELVPYELILDIREAVQKHAVEVRLVGFDAGKLKMQIQPSNLKTVH